MRAAASESRGALTPRLAHLHRCDRTAEPSRRSIARIRASPSSAVDSWPSLLPASARDAPLPRRSPRRRASIVCHSNFAGFSRAASAPLANEVGPALFVRRLPAADRHRERRGGGPLHLTRARAVRMAEEAASHTGRNPSNLRARSRSAALARACMRTATRMHGKSFHWKNYRDVTLIPRHLNFSQISFCIKK